MTCAGTPRWHERRNVGGRHLMPGPPNAPQLRNLANRTVVLTGRFTVTQAQIADRIRRRGSSKVASSVSALTDVVVQGQRSPAYKWGDVGIKLDAVAAERDAGRLIYVINEVELDQLLAGKPLTRAQSSAAANGATANAGVAFRTTRGEGVSNGKTVVEIDLDERDRRLRAHQDLTIQVADYLESVGRDPLSPFGGDCSFDLAWESDQRTVHVVEVKTITPASETQQMRLGLGQVLEYRATLRSQGWRARAYLVVSERPLLDRVSRACAEVGVAVAWPGAFHHLLHHPRRT